LVANIDWLLYRADSLEPIARKLANGTLGLVQVQVRWDKGGSETADDYIYIPIGKEVSRNT